MQEGDDRDVENRLVSLLDFDRLILIKELLRNRTKIVWCMRLQRATDDDESARIEVRGTCLLSSPLAAC
jgi:pre-mRNA-splicing helicase BRR2